MPNRLLGDEDGEQLGFAHRHAGKMRDRTGIIVAVALLIVLDGQQQAVAHEFDVPEDGLPGPQPEMFPHLAAIGVGAAPDLVVDIHHPGIRRPGMKVFMLFAVDHRCSACVPFTVPTAPAAEQARACRRTAPLGRPDRAPLRHGTTGPVGSAVFSAPQSPMPPRWRWP